MSANQKIFIVGNLGRDPESRFSQSGTQIVSFPVAVSEKRKDQNGAVHERVEWFKVTAFGRRAEVLSQYLNKGSQVIIWGHNQTSKYQDKNTGENRYSTELIVDEFQFVGGRNANGGQQGQQPQQAAQPQQQPQQQYQQPQQRAAQQPAPQQPQPQQGGGEFFDDDIPF